MYIIYISGTEKYFLSGEDGDFFFFFCSVLHSYVCLKKDDPTPDISSKLQRKKEYESHCLLTMALFLQ